MQVSDVFFKQEIGDAMITYENEIFLTNEKIVEVMCQSVRMIRRSS